MKHLPLEEISHLRLETGFRDWLSITGYAPTSVYGMPNHIREYLHYLESIRQPLDTVTIQDIHHYFYHLGHRKRQRRSGVLSINYIHKHLQALKQFSLYLRATEQGDVETDIQLPEAISKIPVVLSHAEIQSLYEHCDNTPLGLRDRAMLSIYYGCGLRRNEGVQLDIRDFLPDQHLLYVRKGKNYQERYVPMTTSITHDLAAYLSYGRTIQIKAVTEPAFFLNTSGSRLSGQSMHIRLQRLLAKAGITRAAGLHTLRHAIATHLLQSGMKLGNIARFLGHKSLESTQLYTHLVNE
jgi:integrase/recombinase XerD